MGDLLDTNVLSELRKPRPAPSVVAYFAQHATDQRFISTVSIAEVRFGISLAHDPGKRKDLSIWLSDVLLPLFEGHIFVVSEAVFLRWRILLESGRKSGQTYAQPDLFFAATALEHNLTLVTRNTKDFANIPGLRLLNPWESQIGINVPSE